MLADFSFTPPEQIFENLKNSRAHGWHGETGRAHGEDGRHGRAAGSDKPAPDLNDVKYDAFLANDRTLADPEIVKIEPGGRVLLRIINSSSMSAFHLGLGALEGELIAVDGFAGRADSRPQLPGRGRPAARYPPRPSRRAPAPIPCSPSSRASASRPESSWPRRSAPVAPHPETRRKRRPPRSTLDLERACAPESRWPRARPTAFTSLNLTGEMAGYVWSINSVVWNKDMPPLAVAEGERVELVFVNRTPMPHPMHLHGHEFQVVEIDGERFPGAMRDTVLVTPGRRVVVAFDANNPGWWALHCHLLYHLDAGMFTTIRYI